MIYRCKIDAVLLDSTVGLLVEFVEARTVLSTSIVPPPRKIWNPLEIGLNMVNDDGTTDLVNHPVGVGVFVRD